MPEIWTTLLRNVGPEPTGTDPLEFATAKEESCLPRDAGVASPLAHLGVIRVAGDDAEAFLHSQLTNAIERMPLPGSRLGAWCSAKGRMLALFQVLRVDAGYLLITERELISNLVKRLRMFVLRSKVEVEDVSDGLALIGVAGEAAIPLLAEACGTPPTQAGGVVQAGDLTVLRLRDATPRFIVAAPAEQAGALWGLLSRGLSAVGTDAWRLRDVLAGLPTIKAATTERFVPQMANLEALEGLSYQKGCYPGQEVVARMHYLGRLKRRMYRIRGNSAAPPAAGTLVRDGGGREAGEIVIAARAGRDVFEALAVLRTDAAEREDLRADSATVQLRDLPYPVGDEGAT
ncbi:MAG: folate-binding protein [Ectothiorhodospiraceae bacterium]|jgi:hypothetical protein